MPEIFPVSMKNKPLGVKLFTSVVYFIMIEKSLNGRLVISCLELDGSVGVESKGCVQTIGGWGISMKVKIEIEGALEEDEVLIRCRGLTEEIAAVQKAVSEAAGMTQKFVFYKGNTEYYLMLDEILFFETDERGISAHTRSEVYQIKYKLYELEDILPGFFMRVSKSTILNTNHIYSINRNLTASSVVAFTGTHKQVYVSRYYYKPLISKLEGKRLHR